VIAKYIINIGKIYIGLEETTLNFCKFVLSANGLDVVKWYWHILETIDLQTTGKSSFLNTFLLFF